MNVEKKNEAKKNYRLYYNCLISYCVAIEMFIIIILQKSMNEGVLLYPKILILLSFLFFFLNAVSVKLIPLLMKRE